MRKLIAAALVALLAPAVFADTATDAASQIQGMLVSLVLLDG